MKALIQRVKWARELYELFLDRLVAWAFPPCPVFFRLTCWSPWAMMDR